MLKQLIILLFFFVGIIHCDGCTDGEVLINGLCTANNITPPSSTTAGSTTAASTSLLITLQTGLSETDPNVLEFLVTTTFVGYFFITFSSSFNSDAILFQVDINGVVTAIDSFFQKPFPQSLPVSDISLGGQDNINLLGYQVNAAKKQMVIKFNRLYNTLDAEYDTIFQSGQLFLQRVLFGAPKNTVTTFKDLYPGSFYFLLGANQYACNDGFIFNGQTCIENNMTPLLFKNQGVSSSNVYLDIQYEVDGNNLVMLLTSTSPGYFGIGFGGNIMTSVDMIIANVNTDNANKYIVIADDSWAKSTGAPVYDTLLGGTYDITVLGYEATNQKTSLKFSRPLTDNDAYDFKFLVNQEVPFVFAFNLGSNTLTYHGYSVGWGTLVLESNPDLTCNNNSVFIDGACVTNNISAAGLTQTQTISSPSSQAPLITLQFGLTTKDDQNDSVDFLITIQSFGWFAIGFQNPTSSYIVPPTSMASTDIVIFNVITLNNQQLALSIQDGYAQKNQAPQLDTSIGGKINYFLLGYTINQAQGIIVAKITRKLDTGDKYDYKFKVNSLVPMMYAYTPNINNIQYHDNYRGTTLLDFFYVPPVCTGNEVNINNQCAPSEITELPSSASSGNFNFQFDLSTENQITIRLTLQNPGWFGIGFGSSMTNTNMIIFNQVSQGVLQATPYYSTGESTPQVNANFGTSYNLQLLGYAINTTSVIVKFSMLLSPSNTQEQQSTILNVNQTQSIVYAWGQSLQMEEHTQSNCNGVTFPLQQGYQGGLSNIDFSDTAKKFHYWANFIMWGFLVDIGFIVARFYKTGRFYKEIHGAIMGAIVLFSGFVEIWMIDLHDILFNGNLSMADDLRKTHCIIGFIFLLLFVIEAFGGSFLNYLLSFRTTGGDQSQTVKKIHKYLGYFLYALGKANVIMGAKTEGIESQYMTTSNISLMSVKEEFVNLVDMINSNKPTADIVQAYPNIKYVLYKDGIYNISQIAHPGGHFIFISVNGRDVSRFLVGAYPLESTTMQSYKHSPYAMQLLLKNKIGTLLQPKILSEVSVNQIWRAKKSRDLSSSTSLFLLQHSSNKIQVLSIPQGMEWFGKHFQLSVPQSKISTRLYTNCLSFSPNNQQLYQQFNSNFESLIQSADFNVQPFSSKGENQLPLVIKRYESPTGFSQYLHDSLSSQQESTEIILEGPHGRGLELSSKSDGLHLIVSGGTGIIPFFDLLQFYSKYIMYRAVQKKHGEQVAKRLEISQENFALHVNPQIKLKVICAFNSKEDDCGALKLLEKMKKIDSDSNLNIFDAVISVKSYSSNILTVDNQRFSQSYLEKHVGNLVIERAFICGPPGLNKAVPQILKNLGLSDSQITLV